LTQQTQTQSNPEIARSVQLGDLTANVHDVGSGPSPDELTAMRIPTMLVHGRDDKVIPLSSSQQLAEHIPSARLAVLPGCGHWVQIERTDEFCALVLEFLGRA